MNNKNQALEMLAVHHAEYIKMAKAIAGNNNEVFNSIKNIVKADTKVQIEQYKETISSINKILESQSTNKLAEKESNQLVVSGGTDYTDFYQLIYTKNNSLTKVVELETELTKYDNVVSLINKPVLVDSKVTFGNKKILYAFLFTFLYIFFFILKRAFNNIKTLSENLEIKE